MNVTVSASAPIIEIEIASPLWAQEPAAETTLRAAIAAAAERVPAAGEVSVLLTDDEAIRVLNRNWCGIDQPTNVLSFPHQSDKVPFALIGDIAIAYETVAREAAGEGKPFLHHLAHLAVHGFLHLMGYDHATDSQADAMEELERDILARLEIADPYSDAYRRQEPRPEPGNA
jgi:probable rRNA maturation factor